MIYKIIHENEKAVFLKRRTNSKHNNLCFVHFSSFEKRHKNIKGNYYFNLDTNYIYLPKRDNDANIEEHAINLINTLKNLNIEKIDLMAVSYGTLISAYASRFDIINTVVVFQAPFWGTPLANHNEWNSFNRVASSYLKKRYTGSIGTNYLKDTLVGIKDWSKVKTQKIIFIYGYATKIKGILSIHNNIFFVPEIKKRFKMNNDAVVPFPEYKEILKHNFKRVVYLDNIYHICTILKKYYKLMIKELNLKISID